MKNFTAILFLVFFLFGCEKEEASFTEEVSYTASCPTGFQGPQVTVVKTGTSSRGAEDAKTKAQKSAKAEAEAQLVCEKIIYSRDATFTASCPGGYFGTAIRVTKTDTSSISSATAYNKAYTAAKAEAEEALACTQLRTPTGSASCDLVQCLGKSKQGNPCKNKTTNCTRLCYLH